MKLLIAAVILLLMGVDCKPVSSDNSNMINQRSPFNFVSEPLEVDIQLFYRNSPRKQREIFWLHVSEELLPNSGTKSFKQSAQFRYPYFDNKDRPLVRRRRWIESNINGSMSSVLEERKGHLLTTKSPKDTRVDRGANINIKAQIPVQRDKTWEANLLPGLVKQVIKELKNNEAVSESPSFDGIQLEIESGEGTERNPMKQEALSREKISVHSALPCDQWEKKIRTCWFERNIGDTITFVLATNALAKSNSVNVQWKQEFYNRNTNRTLPVEITPENTMWNVVVGSGGREFRISPITEPDVDYNRFTAIVTVTYPHGHNPSTSIVTFRIRPVPIDLGFVYTGESLVLNIESFVSLPLESMVYHWHIEKYGERSTLPSNMKISPKGSSVAISELRKDQEGIITCSVFTNRGIFMTKKRFLVKELIYNTVTCLLDANGNYKLQTCDVRYMTRVDTVRSCQRLALPQRTGKDDLIHDKNKRHGRPPKTPSERVSNFKKRTTRQAEDVDLNKNLDAAGVSSGEQGGFEVGLPEIATQSTDIMINQNQTPNTVQQQTANFESQPSGIIAPVQRNPSITSGNQQTYGGNLISDAGQQSNPNIAGNAVNLPPDSNMDNRNINSQAFRFPSQSIEHNEVGNSPGLVGIPPGGTGSNQENSVLSNNLQNDPNNKGVYDQYNQLGVPNQQIPGQNINKLAGDTLMPNQDVQKEGGRGNSFDISGNKDNVMKQVPQNSGQDLVLEIDRTSEDTGTKFQDKVSKMIADCVNERQCSGHATCIKPNSDQSGFCKCLTGFHGVGIFCWEDTVYAQHEHALPGEDGVKNLIAKNDLSFAKPIESSIPSEESGRELRQTAKEYDKMP